MPFIEFRMQNFECRTAEVVLNSALCILRSAFSFIGFDQAPFEGAATATPPALPEARYFCGAGPAEVGSGGSGRGFLRTKLYCRIVATVP
jgi:hypothetical protein